MEEKSSNRRIVLVIIFAILAILLAYAFTVIYFFYISPYDISMRLKIFPLLSTESIADQYLDAVVEIDFTAKTQELDEGESVEVFAVNVRKDGYVIASYHDFDYYEIGDLKVISNEGGVYDGQIIFSDETYNLTIIKLTSATGKEVCLPYVNLWEGDVSEDVEIISLQVEYDSNIKTVTVESGLTYDVTATIYAETDENETNGYVGVDFTLEDCFIYESSGEPANSFVFTEYGTLVGLYSYYSDDIDLCFATNVSYVNNVFEDVIATYEADQSAYSNALVSSFVVLDSEEVYLHSETALSEGGYSGYYYFNGDWAEFTTSMSDLAAKTANSSTYEWLYLVSDFSYGTATLAADSVLTEIIVNGQKSTLTSKIEFVTLLYGLESGDEVTIYYYSNYGDADDTTETEHVTFTI